MRVTVCSQFLQTARNAPWEMSTLFASPVESGAPVNRASRPPVDSNLFIIVSKSLDKLAVIISLLELTIPLKEAASLLWYFYRDPLRSLTLLSLNVLSQKS